MVVKCIKHVKMSFFFNDVILHIWNAGKPYKITSYDGFDFPFSLCDLIGEHSLCIMHLSHWKMKMLSIRFFYILFFKLVGFHSCLGFKKYIYTDTLSSIAERWPLTVRLISESEQEQDFLSV